MSIYSILLLSTIFVPILLSFDKNLQFYKKLRYVIPSILIIALFYIIIDIYFTSMGVWGFNPMYHSRIMFINLPIEELLFFIFIPYSSLFIHYSLVLYFPGLKLGNFTSRIVTLIILIFSSLIFFFNIHKMYTVYVCILIIIAMILSIISRSKTINRFYLTFLIILIPFLLVNGILTGSFLNKVVVWYNDKQNLGIRLLTIPVEDFGYAFCLILFNLILIKKIKGDEVIQGIG